MPIQSTREDIGSPQRLNALQDNTAWQFPCGNEEKVRYPPALAPTLHQLRAVLTCIMQRLAWWCDGESDELREYDPQPPVGILTRERPAGVYALIWEPPKKLKDFLQWVEEVN